MKIDPWKVAVGVISALWVVTLILAQRVAQGYDEQDEQHSEAIRELRIENRDMERKWYELRSDVRLLNDQIGRVAKDTGYLVNLWREGRDGTQ